MFARDLVHYLDVAASLHPAATAASRTGTGVDLQGYDEVVAVASLGAWTDGTHTPKLQESTDNTTFTDVSSSNLLGSFTGFSGTAGQNAMQRVGYIGGQRYVRGFVTVAGGTTGVVAAMHIVRGAASRQPLA